MSEAIRILLTTILLICPFICGAEEAIGGDAHSHAKTESGSMPAHCPESFDNCICQGAVQNGSTHSSIAALISLFSSLAVVFVILDLRKTFAMSRMFDVLKGTFDFSPRATHRALLQVFRF